VNHWTNPNSDDDAQLNSSLGYTSEGSPVTSEQLGFLYDPAWNMTQRSVNGAPTIYSVNDFNQVTSSHRLRCE
jgi:hypothetical protein